MVRLVVQSRQVDVQPSFEQNPEEGQESLQDGVAIGLAIQPVLPVTVYIRHQVDSPALTIGAFEPALNDEESYGHFRVSKAPDAISFVGTVALVGERSGETLARGRLRIGQTVNERRVRVPRREGEAALSEPVCLHIWPSFPARGEPQQRVCSE